MMWVAQTQVRVDERGKLWEEPVRLIAAFAEEDTITLDT